ncbi:MAG: DUF1778 domain-containing protein [Candidatus Thiodiazotropha sp.]|jgi:uncharacterized protein (DUF1778 family)
MSVTSGTKQERINLRLKYSAKRALERAASFEGKTVSNFILSSALAHAEKTIHEHEPRVQGAARRKWLFPFQGVQLRNRGLSGLPQGELSD